ncbi:MAG: AlpA family phage regulatory protein [Candidatus Dadabacteria bacterium]|nr:AlpA family phage regulatory protein [Candidatus Dadabacteria bacterium]
MVLPIQKSVRKKQRREGSNLYNYEFPEPVKLSARARGWRLADVEAWIDARENYRAGRLTDKRPSE